MALLKIFIGGVFIWTLRTYLPKSIFWRKLFWKFIWKHPPMKIFRTAIWTKILWTASCDCTLLDFPVQNNITVCNCSNWEKCKKFLWVSTGVKVSSILSIFLFIKRFYFLHENFHRWVFSYELSEQVPYLTWRSVEKFRFYQLGKIGFGKYALLKVFI